MGKIKTPKIKPSNPKKGTVYFDVDEKRYYIYDGKKWEDLTKEIDKLKVEWIKKLEEILKGKRNRQSQIFQKNNLKGGDLE